VAASPVAVAPELVAIAAALRGRIAKLAEELLELTRAEIVELRGDDAVQELLAASLRENVVVGLDVIEHAIDVGRLEAPAAAAEYARRLAHRGVPVDALLRAYRLGGFKFIEWWLEELSGRQLDGEELLAVVQAVTRATFRYVDLISEQLIAVYVGERDRWLKTTSSSRTLLVRSLLNGDVDDVAHAEATLGWALDRTQVGVVAWVTGGSGAGAGPRLLDRVGSALFATYSPAPLVVTADETTLWAWLPARIGAVL
jgi:hypothetical protein